MYVFETAYKLMSAFMVMSEGTLVTSPDQALVMLQRSL